MTYSDRTHDSRLIGYQRGALNRKATPPKITNVAPSVHTLGAQLTSFEVFTDFAHQVGAPNVQASVATISDDGQRVVLLFSHKDFPGARFDYRAKAPGQDDHEKLWLAEELATGALHRIMREDPATADATGITWLRTDGQLLRADS